jgi:L-lactate dehydrogenase complex protein LldG
MSAREEILTRVRDAISSAGDMAAAEIPRGYRAHIDASVETFIERLHHYGVSTHRAREDELEPAIRTALRKRDARRVIAPDGLPEAWLEGIEPMRDNPPLDPQALDQSDGLLSTCAEAIAETGTIVLDGGAGMGRRALSLVPDYHLCVVRADQIAGSVPEALARLDPVRPLTFVSGPSATVDIELVRVSGVHGPRTLEVIVALMPNS